STIHLPALGPGNARTAVERAEELGAERATPGRGDGRPAPPDGERLGSAGRKAVDPAAGGSADPRHFIRGGVSPRGPTGGGTHLGDPLWAGRVAHDSAGDAVGRGKGSFHHPGGLGSLSSV